MDIQPQGCCYICMAKHFADAFLYQCHFQYTSLRSCAGACDSSAFSNHSGAERIQNNTDSFAVPLVCPSGRSADRRSPADRKRLFQEDYHIFRQRNNAYRRFAFRCLHDQARVSILPDTLCRTFDPNRAVLEVNVRNAERTDLAKPQSSVCRKKNPCVLVIG